MTDEQIDEIDHDIRMRGASTEQARWLIAALREARADARAMAAKWAWPSLRALGIHCVLCSADTQNVLMDDFRHAPDCLAAKYLVTP